MSLRWLVGLGFVAAVLGIGCSFGNAEVVRRDQLGGTLVLRGMQGPAMQDAQRLMSEHCRGPATIVSEQNVVVGQQTTTGAQTQYGETQGRRRTSGSQYTTASSTTQNVTEYHITYQCGTAVVAQGAPAPVDPAAQPVMQPQ